jgi:hypothetical protein
MTFSDLLTQLDLLDRDDKLRVIDHLMAFLETEEAQGQREDEAAEARWDAAFANSQDMLACMADAARKNRELGLNQELDPDQL